MKVEFMWNKSMEAITREAVGGRDDMLFLANEAKKKMHDYVPEDTGSLRTNVRVTADEDEGHISYNSPYAHYQYMGEIYGPNYPIIDGGNVVGFYSPPHKTPTGRKMKYSNPQATDHWDKAMMNAHKDELAQAYENYLKGKR